MQTSPAALPVAWLQPLPQGYRIPLWRWILLPAAAIMLHRAKGVWLNGELKVLEDRLDFTQSQFIKSARTPPARWSIPLDRISSVDFTKGVVSETIEIHHADGVMKLMAARSGDFIPTLRSAIAAATA